MRGRAGGGRGEQGRMPMTSFTRARVQAHAPPHYLLPLPPLPFYAHANDGQWQVIGGIWGEVGKRFQLFGEACTASNAWQWKSSWPASAYIVE